MRGKLAEDKAMTVQRGTCSRAVSRSRNSIEDETVICLDGRLTYQVVPGGDRRQIVGPPLARYFVRQRESRRCPVIRTLFCGVVVALGLGLATAAPAAAQQPVIERATVHDTFDDDLYLDLCGISTTTTVVERWTLTTYPDGSQVFHDVRTFTSADPRLPVEKDAATAFYAADGSWRVVGKPIQLIGPDGGTLLLDAGWISFNSDGDVSTVRGPHPSTVVDLADYYCPHQ